MRSTEQAGGTGRPVKSTDAGEVNQKISQCQSVNGHTESEQHLAELGKKTKRNASVACFAANGITYILYYSAFLKRVMAWREDDFFPQAITTSAGGLTVT